MFNPILGKYCREWIRENVGEGGGIKRAMGWRQKAVTNYSRLREGKGIGRWWDDKIGRVEDVECSKCGEEEHTPDHIVFRCGKDSLVGTTLL